MRRSANVEVCENGYIVHIYSIGDKGDKGTETFIANDEKEVGDIVAVKLGKDKKK